MGENWRNRPNFKSTDVAAIETLMGAAILGRHTSPYFKVPPVCI